VSDLASPARRQRVLVVYTFLSHYRLALFEHLAARYDLTVLHSGAPLATPRSAFREIVSPVYRFGRRLHVQPTVLRELWRGRYDAVVVFLDVAWPASVLATLLHPSAVRCITWGAWLTGNRPADALRRFLIDRSDASLFYGARSRDAFRRYGCRARLIVANNTYHVAQSAMAFEHPVKDRLLAVGSLHPRKQYDVLLEAFARIAPDVPPSIRLVLVGDGPERGALEALARRLLPSDRVEFAGESTDDAVLREHYARALASISYGQAGLSVLQSLGHGVPFVTRADAVSGGEIDNLHHEVNGLLCDDGERSLEAALRRLCLDVEWARTLGRAARAYYERYATMENMAQGFIDAIEDTDLATVDPAIGAGE
jgi:glycosyltransferase involved in cell wall biosynthesis